MHSDYRHPKHEAISRLLQDGEGRTDNSIAAALKVDRRAVARVRGIIGVPPVTNGTTVADKIERFSSKPDANGHVTWTGRRNGGTPVMRHQGREIAAAAAAFERRTGRAPVGICRADCGVQHCIADAHVVDDLERRSLRMQERALYGLDPQPWDECPEGHGWHKHGRIEPDLTPYCRACNTDRARRARASKKGK